jgi:hypothetical protein
MGKCKWQMGTRLVNVRPLLYNKLNQTNKGNKMQSVKITTVKVNTGLMHEFVYECNSEDILLAIVKGTVESCSSTGWAMSGMEIA